MTALPHAEDKPPSDRICPHWVAGIGAGAGGLEAIQHLFAEMPANIPVAFIIVRHIGPGHADPLADLLANQTTLPVKTAETNTILEAGSIYIVSPRDRMILLNDRLSLLEPSSKHEAELTVSAMDVLLLSLSVSAGTKAIAIMLSGIDQDGRRGCASIRNHGGLVLAQRPESTVFPNMPRHIIDSGLASMDAAPCAMADLIGRHVGGKSVPAISCSRGDRDDAALRRTIALLAAKFTFDVRIYDPSLVAECIRSRLIDTHAKSLLDYASSLEEDDQEPAKLYDRIRSDATAFFHDPEALDALATNVGPDLIERMSNGRPLRVWVPACATGEEAYSLAMVFSHQASQAKKAVELEVIASDRQTASLMRARTGRYRRNRLDNVPLQLAGQYACDDGSEFIINAQLRRHLTFIDQDMLAVPPLDGFDLVSCRNNLIHLDPVARREALLACSRALRPGGFLFLGRGEHSGQEMRGFAVVNETWRIYQKISATSVDDTSRKVADAYRQRSPETIQPMALEAKAARQSSHMERNKDKGDLRRILAARHPMLEQTIDTLLMSNDSLRRKNQSLRDENRRLVHAHAALDDIATLIAHDLKAPLSIIEDLADNLHNIFATHALEDLALEWLQPMRMRIFALSQVIDDLLSFAQEGPKNVSDLRPVDFGDLLRETLALIGLPKDVRVVINPPSLRIVTWRIPLACVLRNLLGPSIERVACSPRMIRIEAKPDHRYLNIVIIANGEPTAAPAEHLSHAIVRQLLTTMGAELSVGTDLGGTRQTMRLTWPIQASPMFEQHEKKATRDADRTGADER